MLRKFFELDKLRSVDVDSEERISLHREIIKSKPIMLEVFTEIHDLFHNLDQKYFKIDGKRIELGAGAFPVKETYHEVISSDVVDGKQIDIVIDAMNMNLENNSIRSFYAQNVFHHFPDPRKFFSEARRVLKKGGGLILVDPFYGMASSFIYPYISPNEDFDKSQKEWKG